MATVTTTTTAPGVTGAPVTGTPSATASATASTTGSGTAGDGSASGPGLCTPTVATFREGDQGGALQHFQFGIQVTNASASPCVTTGYPGVALLDASGRQIEQATRTPRGYFGGLSSVTTTPPQITLAPGETATALVEGTTAAANSGSCATSPALLFTLPDNTDSTKLAITASTCAGLQVHPLVKGTTGNG